MRADKIATGHNADDVAETVLLNILRGDVPRCARRFELLAVFAAALCSCFCRCVLLPLACFFRSHNPCNPHNAHKPRKTDNAASRAARRS